MASEDDGVNDPAGDRRSTREDELLALRCQLGDRDAFDALIQRWNDPLWRYLRRVAGDDQPAQELAQETWLRVVRGIPTLRDPSRLRAWLFGIARRVAMDSLRHQYAAARHGDVADIADMDVAAAVDADTSHDDLAAMEDELQRLPIVEREVLTLFYLKELSLGEVADVLRVPVGTVKSRLFRARHLLRHELTQKGMKP
jgi:RNA polymerase sigma-70 factor (ECF subfamily)